MSAAYDIALSFASADQGIVEKVYHYLKAEGIKVFFAPSPEAQSVLSGRNQREVFYKIFGLESKYVALFVSQSYLVREVPMEEANIALHKHCGDGTVIPIYLDDAVLPQEMLDPKNTNYFCSNNPVVIADHIAARMKTEGQKKDENSGSSQNTMNVHGNSADRQVFIQTFFGGDQQ